ncbi:carboxypeptidase regulatory-like domain-containing protein [Flavivirga jejuensis]|uniref:Carboxypeptidase regulatory-like domain-containing protein n=1 Tax=Flavivirga jejuensis TaxID=870487 RepID=A0ABT8WTI4_9FLAO|nr:carboxypeptidase regulatory-like domain-containing protein [Flavivirga jejuensis]MDO5976508.1 carboxypeptidase regulatory-like domain-containing protein [Flavivirga jejuensis]
MKKTTLAIFLLFFGVLAFSQVTTSNIKGLILDENASPLPGANVLAIHTPTGTKYGAATNFDGRFNLLNLRVGGPYSITISFVGFQEQTFKNVFLTLGKTTNLDAVLEADNEQLDAVVIQSTGGTGTFGSDRTGAETSVGSRELTRLPTISRSASDFTRLEPSASGNSFGGRNDQFNNFSLDGAIFNNPFGLDAATPGGQTDSQPISLDAIEQIQVSLAPYDVTQSGFTGASVNAVTKSGTNEFHGTVYGFFRNEDLTGGKVNGEDVPTSNLEQNQYGFSIGGPIVKDKLFFFTNFEKDERTDLGTNGWVPNTGSGAVNESRVLESDFIAVQDALSNLGYDTGSFEGFNYGSESTKGIFKLDWNINDNNRLAIIYNFLNASKEKPAHPTALSSRGPSFQTLQFENSGYEINNKLNSVQLELNSTLPGDITNKFQFGYTHFDDFRKPLSGPAPVITIQDGAGSNYIIAGHEPFSINNELDQKVIQLTNNLNIVRGNHTYTVGFSFEKFAFKNSFNLVNYESFSLGVFPYFGIFAPYANVQEFLDNAQPGGLVDQYLTATQNAFDTFNTNGTGNDGGWKLAELNVGQLSFYVQDDWNITDAFKVTYGVRFDKPLYFNTGDLIQKYIDTDNGATRDNSVSYFNPNKNEEVNLDSTTLPNNDWLISPRLGFNWDVNNENKTQVRGGTGLFTGRFPFVWLGNQVSGADDGFFQLIDPDYKWPQVWRTNIGADHRLENGLTITTDISFTKDLNAAHVQNWGLRNPTGTLNAPGDDRPVYLSGDSGNNAYVFTNSDKGRIWNATLKLQKTFENGFYTSLAYNYLNSKDVNSIEAEITGDAFDFNPNLGNANDDVLSYSKYGDTHRFVGVGSKKWVYGNDKWATTISTFFEYAQGGRFNYTYAGNINGDSSFQNNDLIYIPTASEVQQMQFSGSGQAEDFERFIQQDKYLNDNRGSYFDRYGALAPWRGRWDIKVLQDFKFNVSEDKTNTLQISLDILNFGNLLNSDWGVVEQPNNISPIGVDTSGSVPVYTFNGGSDAQTFGFDSSLASRWQAQVGLRYIF